MNETRSGTSKPEPEPKQKRISRRETLGAVSLLSVAGFSAGKKVYARAAIKESLGLEPEPGSALSG